jgi:O-antigen ligase
MLVGIIVVAGVLLGAAHHRPVGRALADVRRTRLSLSSPERANEWHATWHIAATHPVVGIGPGPILLLWRRPSGQVAAVAFTHNEYLQLLAQQGVVGLGALALVAAGILRRLMGASRRHRPARAAGAVAALTAFAMQSGLDFLWHLPGIVLVVAVLVGLGQAPGEANPAGHIDAVAGCV